MQLYCQVNDHPTFESGVITGNENWIYGYILGNQAKVITMEAFAMSTAQKCKSKDHAYHFPQHQWSYIPGICFSVG